MKTTVLILIVVTLIWPLNEVQAQESTTSERYTYKEGDPNGIGK